MLLDVTKYDDSKPFLLVDVDGVINTINHSQRTSLYDIFKVGPFWIRIRHEMKDWLARLSEHYHLVWCTMWDDLANEALSPKLGLPTLPYIPCWESQDEDTFWKGYRLHTKVPGIKLFMKDRPFAFIDDGLMKGDMVWAELRNEEVAPTKFLYVDPRMGLQEHHVNKLVGWTKLMKAKTE